VDRKELRGLRVQDHEIQKGIPHGDLEARAIGGEQGHGDDVDEEQEPERARGSAGRVGRPAEKDPVDQQAERDDPLRAVAGLLPDDPRRQQGEQEVGRGSNGQFGRRHLRGLPREEAEDEDQRDEPATHGSEGVHPLGEGDELARSRARVRPRGSHGVT
jgi:hypothetical protein